MHLGLAALYAEELREQSLGALLGRGPRAGLGTAHDGTVARLVGVGVRVGVRVGARDRIGLRVGAGARVGHDAAVARLGASQQ
eukprot:scaffold31678_cov41-Phaeocystis_antarctica.AAC.1